MTCSEYHILISAKHDREITEAEAQQLEAHLRVCPSCRSYAALTDALFSPVLMEEPPAGLRDSILRKTAEMPLPKPAPGKKRILRIVSVCASAAACLALCLLAAPRFLSMGKADSAAMEIADMELYSAEEDWVDDCAPAADADTGGGHEDAAARNGYLYTTATTQDDALADDSSAYDEAGTPAADVPPPADGTLAVITCRGVLPQGLEEADAVEAAEGIYYIYIDITFARELASDGMECSVSREELLSFPEDGAAALLWIP